MKKTLVTSKRLYMLVVLLLVLCISPAVSLAKVTFDAEKITANYKEISLSQLFWEVQKNTDFVFVYSTEDLNFVPKKKSTSGMHPSKIL